MYKINGLQYINRSTTRTSCRPNRTPITRYIVQALVVSHSITQYHQHNHHHHTHTRGRAHPHTDDSTTSSSIITTSQHRSVPINNKYIRHVQFTFHSRPPIQPPSHPRIYIYSIVCVPYNHIHYTNKQHKTKRTTQMA